MLQKCDRCGAPEASFLKRFGKITKVLCENCRWTPKQLAAAKRNSYRATIRQAVPDITWLDEPSRIKEELGVVSE